MSDTVIDSSYVYNGYESAPHPSGLYYRKAFERKFPRVLRYDYSTKGKGGVGKKTAQTLISRRMDAATGYSRVTTKVSLIDTYASCVSPPLTSYVYIGGPWCTEYYTKGSTVTPNPATLVSDYGVKNLNTEKISNSAYQALYTKLRNAQGIKGGVHLGMLGKTISTLKHPLKSLQHGLQQYYKLNYGLWSKLSRNPRLLRSLKNRQILETLGDTWLEFNFGYGNIAREVEEIAVECAKHSIQQESSTLVTTAKGQYSDGGTTNGVTTIGGFAVNAPFEAIWRKEETFSVVYKLMVLTSFGLFDVTDRVSAMAASASGLGIAFNDFLPTVWELIPYSWLVDYVVPIGTIINNLNTATRGVVYCVAMEKSKSHYYTNGHISKPPGYATGGGTLGGFEVEIESFIRKRINIEIPPGVGISYPEDWKQMANIGALLMRHK